MAAFTPVVWEPAGGCPGDPGGLTRAAPDGADTVVKVVRARPRIAVQRASDPGVGADGNDGNPGSHQGSGGGGLGDVRDSRDCGTDGIVPGCVAEPDKDPLAARPPADPGIRCDLLQGEQLSLRCVATVACGPGVHRDRDIRNAGSGGQLVLEGVRAGCRNWEILVVPGTPGHVESGECRVVDDRVDARLDRANDRSHAPGGVSEQINVGLCDPRRYMDSDRLFLGHAFRQGQVVHRRVYRHRWCRGHSRPLRHGHFGREEPPCRRVPRTCAAAEPPRLRRPRGRRSGCAFPGRRRGPAVLPHQTADAR